VLRLRKCSFIKDKFQIVQEVASDEYVSLVHAIIKQESGFAPMALVKQ
jgi:soluble lytic murein transglycosylase-like protein